ncbi:MAG: DUF4339 domain-containing protein [Acidobacteriota bacterium]
MSVWFYARDDERRGPATPQVLQGLIESGTIDGETLVWTEGMEQWSALRDVDALRDLLPEPAHRPARAPEGQHLPGPPPLPAPSLPHPGQPSRFRPRRVLVASRRLLGIGCFVVVLIAGLVAFFFLRDATTRTPEPGAVFIDANPWGEVRSIDGPSDPVRLPDTGERTTPFEWDVPPGTYQIVVVHPPSRRQETCELHVREEAVASCWLDLAPVDATTYFQHIGW